MDMHVVVRFLPCLDESFILSGVLERINAGRLMPQAAVYVPGAPFAMIITTEARKRFYGRLWWARCIGKIDGNVRIQRKAQPLRQIECVVEGLRALLADGSSFQGRIFLGGMSQVGVLLSK